MGGWALSEAYVQPPWHDVTETVWLHCDEAQQVGCLRGLEVWKVVRWCRTHASGHNLLGVVDGGVDEAGMSTAAPDQSAVLRGWMDQGLDGYLQSCCSSAPTRASKSPQERDAWCQLVAKWLKVSVIRERPVQCNSEVLGLGAEGQGFFVAVDFKITFSFLVVKVEGCRHHFCSAEF